MSTILRKAKSMPVLLQRMKSIPFLLKRKKVEEKLEAIIQSSELFSGSSSDHYLDVDRLRRHRLAERLVDEVLLLHDQRDVDDGIWYWGNDINREFPMTY